MRESDNKFRKRLALYCLPFLLILVVALREVPEVASLTDDVSNDGTTASWAQQASPQAFSLDINPQEVGFHTKSLFFCSVGCRQHLAFAASASITAGQELLHLMSVQRK